MNCRAATFSAAALWLACVTVVCAEDGPSPASAPAPAPEPVPADAIVCRYEKPIGSHLRIKVCRTRAQIRAAEEEKRRAMDEARSRDHQ